MSRIGKKTVSVPNGVTFKLVEGTVIELSGPKGVLRKDFLGRVALKQEGNIINVALSSDEVPAYWGLYRTILKNMMDGVSVGYTRSLELHGVGYKAAMAGKDLSITCGFSHPVVVKAQAGISLDVDKAGKIVVTGADKEMVGQVAASIRAIKPPEPYHAKGIRYVGEHIVTKVGKSAGKK